MGKRLGLIIGVNNYQDTTFRSLQYAETDARSLAQWLVHTRGGQWNPADVQVMLGAEATRELAETLISQICLHMAGSEDLVLIYFAGNAFVDQASGEGFLACCNTRYQQSGSGLNLLAMVSQIMARSAAAQILCILDCVQIGPLWNMRRASPFDYQPLLGPTIQSGLQQMQGRLLYCTCRGTETTPEVGEKNLGAFMYHLVMGVGGPAVDPASGQVTLQRLHPFLSEQLGNQHRPQVFGREERPMVLVGEMPSFKMSSGTLFPSNGPMGSAPDRSGISTAQQMSQVSPSASGLGQVATMGGPDQGLLQQCQQMIHQARQLVQMQNLQQAYQLTEKILQMNPNFVEGLILKGQILGAIGQFDEALITVKQLIQVDPENPLGWSMAAALLANTNQFDEAMSAVDRSLSLDPSNSETISIKVMIREKLAGVQADTGKRSRLIAPSKQPKENVVSFLIGTGIQLLGVAIGTVGAFLLLIKPDLPRPLGFGLESIGLALLCVNAWRGAFLYGWKRLIPVLFFSLVTVGIAGALYKVRPAYNFILTHVSTSFTMMVPLIFLVIWLAAAAALPVPVGIVGWITGTIVRARGKRK